ncbi:hypothetical protein V6N13_001486 [Hibiscus sabdariffa]
MPTQEQDDVSDGGLQQDHVYDAEDFRIHKIFQEVFQHKRCGDDEQQDHVGSLAQEQDYAEDIPGTAPTQEQEDVRMVSSRIMQA